MENKEPITNAIIEHYSIGSYTNIKTNKFFGCYSYSQTYKEVKPKTEIELIAEFFARLDERIQNMSEEEYQAYKRKMNYE